MKRLSPRPPSLPDAFKPRGEGEGILRRMRRALDAPVIGRPNPGDERGMALLLALVMIVLITAFIAEFNYSARTKIIGAYHARDDTRAYYMAKSGTRLYGLLLIVGAQLDGNPMIAGITEMLPFDLAGADAVCQSLPFLDTAMVKYLVGVGGSLDDEEKEGLGEFFSGSGDDPHGDLDESEEGTNEDGGPPRRGLLDFDGDFKVECSDELGRVNLNGFGNTSWLATPIEQHPVGQLMFGLLAPPEYDPLFEERLKIDRWELIGNFKDWVDPDSERSGFWGGDEDGEYDQYEPRYKAKNKRFDTVEEARLVAGVTDEVWETFGDSFTVHGGNNGTINVNTASPHMLRALLRATVDPYTNPLVLDQVVQAVNLTLKQPLLGGPVKKQGDFLVRIKTVSTQLGTPIVFMPGGEAALTKMVAVNSKRFRITTTGYINDSVRTIEAIVRVNKSRVRYLQWKEY
jgi:type II secretory pathway component PulK